MASNITNLLPIFASALKKELGIEGNTSSDGRRCGLAVLDANLVLSARILHELYHMGY